MPHHSHYDYQTRLYRITLTCSDCGTTRDVQSERHQPTAPDPEAAETFRWHSGNGRYLTRCRDCERAHVRRWRENRRVPAGSVTGVESLGLSRRFGVELELIFPRTTAEDIREELVSAGLRGWAVKSDGSLSASDGYGREVVSPPLSGEDGFNQIRTACEVLQRLGAKPNRTCGLHVHHEVRDLGLDDFKRLAESWARNQPRIDQLVSASRRGGSYCRPLSRADRNGIRNLTDLRRIYNAVRGRYRALNFLSYTRYGTVEIRQHQGTADADKIINWIKLGRAIIERSRVGMVDTTRTLDSFFGQLGDYLDDSARVFFINRAAVLAGETPPVTEPAEPILVPSWSAAAAAADTDAGTDIPF